MLNLFLTIALTSSIYIIFQLFGKWNVQTFQAIVANYLACTLLGAYFTGFNELKETVIQSQAALPYGLGLGLLFILILTLIGLSTKTMGMTTTTISDKLSLVIPVVASFILYQDNVTAIKVAGIILSIVSVLLIVGLQKGDNQIMKKFWFYPLIVFLGSGLISVLLKEVQFSFPDLNYNTFLIFLFGFAFLFGFIGLIYNVVIKSEKLSKNSLLLGFLLGIPNYFSIYFYLKSLNIPNLNSSIVFPSINLGVVLMTAGIGVLVFQEKWNKIQVFGIIIAIIAIGLFMYESYLNGVSV